MPNANSVVMKRPEMNRSGIAKLAENLVDLIAEQLDLNLYSQHD